MPRRSFLLNVTLIQDLLDRKGWDHAKLASERPAIDQATLSRVLENGGKASMKTLVNIAGKLGYEGKHLELTLDEDRAPYRPIASKQASTASPSDELAFTSNQLTIKAIGHPDVIRRLTAAQLTEAWRSLYRTEGTGTIEDLRAGSIVINMRADDTATIDLIGSFLAWRLQCLGIYEMLVGFSDDKTHDTIAYILSHFSFSDHVTHTRCEASIAAQQRTTVATGKGLLTIQLEPNEHMMGGRAPNTFLIALALLAARRDNAEEWKTAADRWGTVVENLRSSVASTDRALSESAKDAVLRAANAAEKAVRAAHTATVTRDAAVGTWRSMLSAVKRTFAVRRALNAVFKFARVDKAASGYTYTNLETSSNVWLFTSTLLPRHITTAERYWKSSKRDAPPEGARFPEDAAIESQAAILLDDETFLNQPQHQSA